jgi:SAM-dependent methyltransferase
MFAPVVVAAGFDAAAAAHAQARALWHDDVGHELLLREADAVASGIAVPRAVDTGCGSGDDSVALAERGWRVEAVDLSTRMVDLARALASKHASITVHCGDAAEFLRAHPGCFDLAAAVGEVVCYTPDWLGFLGDLTRAVRPNGVVVGTFVPLENAVTHDPALTLVPTADGSWAIRERESPLLHIRALASDELIAALEFHGGTDIVVVWDARSPLRAAYRCTVT